MKIEIGKKYRMKDYPSAYLYVHILGRESDIIPISFDEDKRFFGVVIYQHSLISRITYDTSLGVWGEDGSWDGAYLDDCNAIVSEWESTND
jgi:hypothetical protein